MGIVRDYGPDGVSVVMASNNQGRIEPFLFERRQDAERAIDYLQAGEISTVVGWHGVEILDQHAAQRLMFGTRSLREA